MMQSVGEVMAIGRTFPESLQKALRSLETGRAGLNCDPGRARVRRASTTDELVRMVVARHARAALPARGRAAARRHRSSGCTRPPASTRGSSTRWPRSSRSASVAGGARRRRPRPARLAAGQAARLRRRAARVRCGASPRRDVRAARQRRRRARSPTRRSTRARRSSRRRRRTTTAPTRTRTRSRRSTRPAVVILGSGPNRIGQGVEFDYCCVHAAFALSDAGFETVMVNCNPETVSTDYDTSDRLFFEPLTDRRRAQRVPTRCRRPGRRARAA